MTAIAPPVIAMVNEKDEHGLDGHPAEAAESPEDDEDDPEEDPELRDAQQEAKEAQQEEDRRQDIENASQDRETDALEHANPNYHRDEPPEDS